MTWEAVLISLGLVVATILIHYEVLRLISFRLTHIHIAPRARILLVQGAALLSHLLQVSLYAAAYSWLHGIGHGRIHGAASFDFVDSFYFSASSYTSLGIGDLYPEGSLRLVSGIEALNGLVMIGWTASFTYLAMERFWHLGGPNGRRRPKKD